MPALQASRCRVNGNHVLVLFWRQCRFLYWPFVCFTEDWIKIRPAPKKSPCTFSHDPVSGLTLGAFHLVKISGISASAVNGTRFVGSSHWKMPRKRGKSKKVGPFSRLEFPNGMSCSIYVSRSLYQFQIHGRTPRRTVVYELMEQLFTNRKFHFCSHRNFRFFFLNGKRPLNSDQDLLIDIIYSKFISLYCTRSPSVDLKEQIKEVKRQAKTEIQTIAS